MKATIFLSKEDLHNMLLERWAPRTDRYLQDGPQAPLRPVRIKSISISAHDGKHDSGYIEFTDEPEEPPAEDDDLPF